MSVLIYVIVFSEEMSTEKLAETEMASRLFQALMELEENM